MAKTQAPSYGRTLKEDLEALDPTAWALLGALGGILSDEEQKELREANRTHGWRYSGEGTHPVWVKVRDPVNSEAAEALRTRHRKYLEIESCWRDECAAGRRVVTGVSSLSNQRETIDGPSIGLPPTAQGEFRIDVMVETAVVRRRGVSIIFTALRVEVPLESVEETDALETTSAPTSNHKRPTPVQDLIRLAEKRLLQGGVPLDCTLWQTWHRQVEEEIDRMRDEELTYRDLPDRRTMKRYFDLHHRPST